MKIKSGDTVLIIRGKDRGKIGKVVKVFRKNARAVIEGLNLVKKHVKPKRQGEKGKIIEIPAPLDISKLKLICPNCHKAVRVGHRIEDGKKYRICKKCQKIIS